jgi:hypothetical protein
MPIAARRATAPLDCARRSAWPGAPLLYLDALTGRKPTARRVVADWPWPVAIGAAGAVDGPGDHWAPRRVPRAPSFGRDLGGRDRLRAVCRTIGQLIGRCVSNGGRSARRCSGPASSSTSMTTLSSPESSEVLSSDTPACDLDAVQVRARSTALIVTAGAHHTGDSRPHPPTARSFPTT